MEKMKFAMGFSTVGFSIADWGSIREGSGAKSAVFQVTLPRHLEAPGPSYPHVHARPGDNSSLALGSTYVRPRYRAAEKGLITA